MQTELAFRTLIGLFEAAVARSLPLRGEVADKICLEIVRAEREETISFRQLRTRARAFALWLVEAERVQIADRVAILGKNRADWDVALWGTILAGAVPVLIDPEVPVETVKNHFLHTDARVIIVADDYSDADQRQELKDFASHQGRDLIEMIDELLCVPERKPSDVPRGDLGLLTRIRTQIKADDTAVILCTSGTTGEPREVELTHANLIANVQGAVQEVKLTPEDKLGHIIPPHHSFGFTVGKLLPLWVGATNVYTNKYRRIPELIADKNITIFVGTPAVFTVLARRIEENIAKRKAQSLTVRLLDRYMPKLLGKKIIKKLGWDNLRFFLSGAAPMPMWVLEVFWRRCLELREGYGTTENSPVYGLNSNQRKLGSVGRPIPTLQVQIRDRDNKVLSPGQKGEIVLGGPCIMKGYYRNPVASGEVLETDSSGIRWLHTGDLGYLDGEGYLFITGRKKYVIVLPGGKNVNPEFVESELSQAQYVKEILVVPGLQENAVGVSQEVVKAIVQPAWDTIQAGTGLSCSDLLDQPQFLKNLIWQNINEFQRQSRHLSHFQKVCSQHLEIRIDEFVKTSTGKIKRDLYIKMDRKT
jgi:long-chain acyl-CoA synthetase